MEERLQKLLSASGVCSRRQAEAYILAGRVTVNGCQAGLGDKADPARWVTTGMVGIRLPSTATEPSTSPCLHSTCRGKVAKP